MMQMPGGIIVNTKTGTFHPVFFRLAPTPSSDWDSPVQRYKSKAHHTAGFASIEEAKEWFAGDEAKSFGAYDTGEQWKWDGEDVPAIVHWFSTKTQAA